MTKQKNVRAVEAQAADTPAVEAPAVEAPAVEAPAVEAHRIKLVGATPVAKLTIASVVGLIAMSKLPPLHVTNSSGEEERNPTRLFRVARFAGYCSGIKNGVSAYGPWAAMQGEFAAVSFETGENFVSKSCIIPGSMGDALVTTAEELLGRDASARLSFSIDVYVQRSSREPTKKYEYVCKPNIDTAFTSPAITLLNHDM